MDNPYSAPAAELELQQQSMRKKSGWKLFFWFYLIIEVLGMLSLFFGSEPLFDIVGELVIYPFVLLGLFAFAYNKKIAVPILWRLVMVVLFAWDCYIFSSFYRENLLEGLSILEVVGLAIPIGLIVFLQYYALYQYAFQSKEIWSKA